MSRRLAEYLALVEARTAYLYHGTSLFKGGQIMVDDRIQANTVHVIEDREVAGTSLSRNPSVSSRYGMVVFVLDQVRLRQRNRLIPIDYWRRTSAISPAHKREAGIHYEAEEFLVGDLTGFSRYLVEVRLPSQIFRHLEAKDDEGILSHGETAIYRHPNLRVLWTATGNITYPNRSRAA